MGNEVKFTIKCKMDERWVNDFCSMLKHMEKCGNIGHSSVVAFFSDGDGDFRPKFEINREFEKQNGHWKDELGIKMPEIEVLFDAG